VFPPGYTAVPLSLGYIPLLEMNRQAQFLALSAALTRCKQNSMCNIQGSIHFFNNKTAAVKVQVIKNQTHQKQAQ
jgi:hypothetical protein